MKYPLKSLVYEKVRSRKHIIDVNLLKELNDDGEEVSMRELNKVLMKLEILGLVTVRWSGKDKRRIEVVEKPSREGL